LRSRVVSGDRGYYGWTLLVAATIGIATAASNLLGGVLMDRINPRILLSLSQLLQAATLVLAAVLSGPGPLLIYGAMLGATQGLNGSIKASVHAYYSGRRHIGSIKGLASTISVAGTSVGPLVVALGFDLSGSYLPVLLVCAALPLVVAVMLQVARLERADETIA